VCIAGRQGQEGRQGSKGYGEGNSLQGRQPVIGLGHRIVLQPEALPNGLKQIREGHVDANHEEGLEFKSSTDGWLQVPLLVALT
jgi:hypothetical protein